MSRQASPEDRLEVSISGASSGPLAGVKVLEFAGIGPVPMAAMQLADMGATILRIERPTPVDLGIQRPLKFNLLLRGRKAIAIDLKSEESISHILDLVMQADILLEGFRPGVMERMGLGPEECLLRNPKLVYGRMTGWGQSGPLAKSAGHDINYIAVTGVLNAIGRKDQPPSIPLALVGDFGGGAMFLVSGVLAALLRARTDGLGQVVDAAIVDGAASLATTFYGLQAAGQWSDSRGSNILDSGAPFYDVYECSCGLWISIGPVEKRFFFELLKRIDIQDAGRDAFLDSGNWDRLRNALTRRFLERSRDERTELLEGTDVCFAPVLGLQEAADHPHLKARNTFIEIDGVVQPAPAPRFSRTPAAIPSAPTAAVAWESKILDWFASQA